MKDVQRYGLNGIGNTLIFFFLFFKPIEQFYELIEKYSTSKMLFMLEYTAMLLLTNRIGDVKAGRYAKIRKADVIFP